jgi:hypothetical protein
MDFGRCALDLRHPAPPNPQPEAAEVDRDVTVTRVALLDCPDHGTLGRQIRPAEQGG